MYLLILNFNLKVIKMPKSCPKNKVNHFKKVTKIKSFIREQDEIMHISLAPCPQAVMVTLKKKKERKKERKKPLKLIIDVVQCKC